MTQIKLINTLEELNNFAKQIASEIKLGTVVCLSGDLGVGKTTFAQYLIRNMVGSDVEVNSPTFNLVHTYDGIKFPIWHFDLYRLDNCNDAYELGIEDAFIYGVSIIEWPQIIDSILPKDTIDIQLEFTSNKKSRKMTLKNFS